MLNNVSNFASDVQVHVGLLPKERDGMSAILCVLPQCAMVLMGKCALFLAIEIKLGQVVLPLGTVWMLALLPN